jgi:spore coat protein H
MSFLPASSPLSSPGRVHRASQVVVVALSGLFLLAVLTAALALQIGHGFDSLAASIETEGLFNLTNVWTVHLKFSPEEFAAMEPKGGIGGPSGPGGLGGAPGGPGGFGPGMVIAPMFISQGDQNHDGRLDRNEFEALSRKWFTAWDTNRSGTLELEEVRGGLDPRSSPGPLAFGRGPLGGPQPPRADGKRNGMAGMMGLDYQYVHADLDFEGWQFRNVSVRYKGNNTFMMSRNSLKRPLKIDLNKGYGGRKLGGVAKLNLHNGVNDPSWMNEVLSHRLFGDAGVPAPRTAYARVYVTVPGKYDRKYFGLYSLVENVDNDFLRARFGTRKGALFKPVTRQLFEDRGDKWADYKATYDPKTSVAEEQAARIVAFSKLVSHACDSEFASRLEEFLDLDEFAGFMAVTVWLSTMDSLLSMGQNFLVYLHPKTQQFQFIPWDLDHSFGQFPMAGSQQDLETLSIHKPWTGQNLFLERVFKVDQFKRRYLARLKEFSETIFRPERFAVQVDEIAVALRLAVEDESSEMFARFNKVVAGESVSGFGFGGGPPGPRPQSQNERGPRFGPPGFGQARKPIKGFVISRAQSVQEQLAGKEGTTLMQFGPGGPGRPGGPRGPGGPNGPGGPGGPGGFDPGLMFARAFLQALDANRDGRISREEFIEGFCKWFDSWNTDHSGTLSEEQLRIGINKDLMPFRGGAPPGFGQPPEFDGPPDSLDEVE